MVFGILTPVFLRTYLLLLVRGQGGFGTGFCELIDLTGLREAIFYPDRHL
jgi:hypothetical protein